MCAGGGGLRTLIRDLQVPGSNLGLRFGGVGVELSWHSVRSALLTQVRFPGAARDFSPRVEFQCRLCVRKAPVCSRMR